MLNTYMGCRLLIILDTFDAKNADCRNMYVTMDNYCDRNTLNVLNPGRVILEAQTTIKAVKSASVHCYARSGVSGNLSASFLAGKF